MNLGELRGGRRSGVLGAYALAFALSILGCGNEREGTGILPGGNQNIPPDSGLNNGGSDAGPSGQGQDSAVPNPMPDSGTPVDSFLCPTQEPLAETTQAILYFVENHGNLYLATMGAAPVCSLSFETKLDPYSGYQSINVPVEETDLPNSAVRVEVNFNTCIPAQQAAMVMQVRTSLCENCLPSTAETHVFGAVDSQPLCRDTSNPVCGDPTSTEVCQPLCLSKVTVKGENGQNLTVDSDICLKF